MKSILVTGATGFIGNHLIQTLLGLNFRVTAAVRNFPEKKFGNVSYVIIPDINESTNWKNALKDINVVVHLAGRAHILRETSFAPQQEFNKINTEGTINLARQCLDAKVKQFIFLSSIGAVANKSVERLNENSICCPETPYGVSKLNAEHKLKELEDAEDFYWTILRPPLVYGPANPGNMNRLIKLVHSGIPLPLGAVKNSRSLIFVGNLVSAVIRSIEHPKSKNQTFMVCDDTDLSSLQLIQLISKASNKPSRCISIPPQSLKALAVLFRKEKAINPILDSLIIDNNKIKSTLAWTPPYSTIDGLKQTVDWYLKSKQ